MAHQFSQIALKINFIILVTYKTHFEITELLSEPNRIASKLLYSTKVYTYHENAIDWIWILWNLSWADRWKILSKEVEK